MRQYRLLSPMIKVVIVLFSLLFSTAQAGLVIGGTRFAYPENQSSISVELKNTSNRDMLVKVEEIKSIVYVRNGSFLFG